MHTMINNQPAMAVRIGGVPPPILSCSQGETGAARRWWELNNPGDWVRGHPSHRAVRNPHAFMNEINHTCFGSQAVSSGRVLGKRAMDDCHLLFPQWLGIATGKRLASLLSTLTKSMLRNGSKVASPSRFQWNKSSDTAIAIRGPSRECAV